MMGQTNPQRRLEEVAPGLVRIVDGNTYVYLSSGHAQHLASNRELVRANTTRDSTSTQPGSRLVESNA